MPKCFPMTAQQNNLLCTLAKSDRELLEPHLEEVQLDRGSALEEPGEPPEFVYFPISGVGSMVAAGKGGRRIEIGLFGREGMSGLSVVTGGDGTPNRVFVQVAGAGLRIESAILAEFLQASATLRGHFLRYLQVLFTQTAQTALSNGQAKLEERLARWILMCHDRIDGDRMELTHEFLAVMLGVRRAGVTVGTHLLEGKGLIRARRGEITVLDRDSLEDVATASYGVPEREYMRLIGVPVSKTDSAA